MVNKTLIQYMYVVWWARLHIYKMIYECFAYVNISENELILTNTSIDYVGVALPTPHFLFI